MKLKAFLAVAVLSFGLFCPGPARAIGIQDFAKLSIDDEATYVTLLVEGVAKELRAQGHPDQAHQAIMFFKDKTKNGGVAQFATNLKAVNAINNRKAINPNNRAIPYQVEDAMAMTLKDQGINIPVSYLLSINKDFKPTGPYRQLYTP
ncbi:MAG: hypothetical protein LV480_10650 [Methylacidiphilales bacterium]|nr:hypothetical protein [Candidatus Methylacidiphilales bacterium]